MLTKFVIYNSVIIFIIAYASYFYNGLELLLEYDVSRFTFLIMGIYAISSIYLGIKGRLANLNLLSFISERLTGIGLVGTVIGSMVLLHMLGTSNMTDASQIIVPLFKGFATVMVTTLFGMLFSLLLDFEVRFVFGTEHPE